MSISHFTELDAWKESQQLVVDLYRLTKGFPAEELYGLSNQLRRAGVSVVSNIAEGFSRGSAKEKVRFYRIAHGSLAEIQAQLFVARDVDYLSPAEFDTFKNSIVRSMKLVSGLMRTAQDKQ